MAVNDRQPVSGDRAPGVPSGKRRRTKKTWQTIRPLRRVVAVLALCLLPVLLLAAIGIGVVYVRLANGPVSLSYLIPAIERQIAEKLGGLKVDVSDVVLSLVERTAAFRLTDVRVRDENDAIVAQAPLATMEIDRSALLRGQFVPTGIVLIKPLMRLAYSDVDGLSLSFARADDANEVAEPASKANQEQVVANAAQPDTQPSGKTNEASRGRVAEESKTGSITVLRTLAGLLGKMRTGPEAGRLLDKIGVRNALIELDYGGRQSRWGVPSGDIDIKHLADRSIVSGLTTVVEAQGQNVVLAFHAEASAKTRQIVLRTSVRDLQSSAVARVAPAFGDLARLDVSLSAEAMFNLKETGAVVDGAMTIEVGAGSVDIAATKGIAPLQLDHGRIVVRFDDQSPIFAIEPSTVRWGGGNELVVTGSIAPALPSARPPVQSPGRTAGAWSFDLKAERGHFVSERGASVRQGIKRWSAVGQFVPAQGRLSIEEAIVAVAGAKLFLKGSRIGDDGALYQLEGRLGSSSVKALPYLWPTTLAPGARKWVRANVIDGKLSDGRFNLTWGPSGALQSKSLLLKGHDLRLLSPRNRLPIAAERALVQLAGDQLEVSVPTANMQLGNSRSIGLKQVKFVVPQLSVDRPTGDLQLKLNGALRDGAAIVSTSAWAKEMPAALFDAAQKRATGRIYGALSASFPLYDGSDLVPQVTGKVAIKDLRIKDVAGRHDLSGGAINFDLARNSINADGEMLIAGVATKLSWQYIKDAPLANQPPVRLQASLDEADRDKLGIKINHIVSGIVDVEVNLIPRADGGVGARVRANATKAAIAMSSLAWVKPAGRPTQLEFDVVPGKKYPVLLDNLRVAGDGIAIQGRAMLDAKYELRAFDLPLFSIDRVTRLQMNGKLHKKGIWHVAVKGQTFEGRSLFRSLFSAGRAAKARKVPAAQQMGVELEAEIATVIGFWNSRLTNVRMSLSKRAGKMQSLKLEGRLANNRLLKAAVVRGVGQRRELHAFSNDAGKAFRLVGFYPKVQNGRLELVVNLDGQGAADKSGVLLVRDFKILGDQVVGELASAPRSGIRRRRAARKRAQQQGQALPFDWMRVPFFVGNGQFILQGAELRGPVVGATIEGKADFGARQIDLSGTYVPLQGLNGALGVIPGLGQILAGPNGEGVLGMKFAVRGPMSQPEVLVNPLSMMAPGIFREMFQISSPSLKVTKPTRPAPGASRRGGSGPKSGNWREGVFGDGN